MTALARVMAENVGNTEKTNKSVASVNKSFFGLSGNNFKLTREIEGLNDSIEYASKNTRSDFNMMSVSFKKGLIGFDAFTQGIIQTKKQLDDYEKQIEVMTEVASRTTGEEQAEILKQIQALQANKTALEKATLEFGLTKQRFKDMSIGALRATFTLENFGKALNGIANNLMGAARAGLSADPFAAAQVGFEGAVDLINKGATTAGKGMQSVGAAMMAVPGPTMAVGAVLSTLGTVIGGASEAVSKLAKDGFGLLMEQAKKMLGNFDKLNQAGYIAAGGLTAMREQAGRTGLTLEQFTNVTTKSADKLLTIGGTVAGGAEKMSATVGSFGDTTKRQLMNLGYSFEDITEGTLDYMESMKLAGQLDKMTVEQQAQGAKEYLVNQRLLTSITGEEAKAAQKRAKEAADQAAVQAKLATMGDDARLKYEALVKAAGPGNQKAVEQLFLFGSVTGDAAVALAGMPSMMQYLKDGVNSVGDASMNASEQTNMLRDNQLKYGQAIGEEARSMSGPLGIATSATGDFAETTRILADSQRLAARATGQTAEEQRKTIEDAKDTQDSATQSLNKARVNAQELAVTLEDLVTKALPSFGKLANFITEQYKDVFNAIRKALGLEARPTETVPTAAVTMAETTEGAVTGRAFGRQSRFLARGARQAADQEVPQFARGGIAKSSEGGGIAILDGVEAVVPLPDNRSIPVDLTGMSQLLSQSSINTNTGVSELAKALTDQMAVQSSKFDDMIKIMQRTADHTGQLADNTI